MIFVAPLAGRCGQRVFFAYSDDDARSAGLMIVSYGFIGSLTRILMGILVHAVVDAVSMPVSQLAVGTASGESATAAGQALGDGSDHCGDFWRRRRLCLSRMGNDRGLADGHAPDGGSLALATFA